MANKRNKKKLNLKKKQKEKQTFGVDDYDEIDEFATQKEKITLGEINEEEDEENYEESKENMVMNMTDSEEESEEVDPRILERMMKYDEDIREQFLQVAKQLDDVNFEDMNNDNDPVVEKIRSKSRLSKSEKLDLLNNDSPEFFSLMNDFKAKIFDLKNSLSPLLNKAKKELPTHRGISLLEVEYHLLLSYCMNISYYFLLKAEGKKVTDHPVILHLVKLRVLLEKIKPIEEKLRYQIEKLLRMGDVESTQKDDPLRFKPNLASLADNNNDDDDDYNQNQVYTVKKIAPAFYDDPEEKKEKTKR